MRGSAMQLSLVAFVAAAAGAAAVSTGGVPTYDCHSIERYGAVAGDASIDAARKNGKALFDALQAASNRKRCPGTGAAVSLGTVEAEVFDTVLVPAGKVFTMVPHAVLDGLHGVTLALQGTISAYPGNTADWPLDEEGSVLDLLAIRHSDHMTLTGNGTLEGNGYRWWWHVVLTGKDNRPHLLRMESCLHTRFEGWTMRNSPQYHVFWEDMLYGLIEGVQIQVDVTAQASLLRSFGLLGERGLPMFPLNTDGIDIAGSDVIVRNCRVDNYDDSLCAKPMSRSGNLTKCTERLLFENHYITHGVGASVGSVTPHRDVSCIRNVTFRNIEFKSPIKAIYVKPNPYTMGDKDGVGIIDQITYENIHIDGAMWWAIWVSTQQQHQPGSGANTHCSFFYPLPGTQCPTDPRVPVTNLKLRNVTAVRSWLSPGVLRCSTDEGQCTGWEWSDVHMTSITHLPMGDHFLCQGLVNPKFTNVNVACTEQLPALSVPPVVV